LVKWDLSVLQNFQFLDNTYGTFIGSGAGEKQSPVNPGLNIKQKLLLERDFIMKGTKCKKNILVLP
jgi:hypothetical protein